MQNKTTNAKPVTKKTIMASLDADLAKQKRIIAALTELQSAYDSEKWPLQGSNLRWTLPNKGRLLRGGLTGTAFLKSKTDRKEYQAAYYRANKAENKAVSEVKNEDKQAKKALRSARNARYYDTHRMEILENASCYRRNRKDGAITEEAKKDFSEMIDNLEDICHGAPQDYCDPAGDACYYAQYDPELEPEFTIKTTRKVQPPVSLAIIRGCLKMKVVS